MKAPPPDLPDTSDPWDLLDVPRGSPAADIRRAYLRRIKIYTPDSHPEAFRRIREAFEALYDDERDRPPTAVEGWDDDDDARPADSIEQGWGQTAAPETGAEPPPASRASALKDERARTDALVYALERAISADERDEAVRLLLEPEHAMLAVDPRVADAVVRVACSVALAQPERFEELWAAFADVLHEQLLEHRHGIMALMRSAAAEWPAWRRAIGDAEAVSRFVELSGTLDDGRLHALGREVAERAEVDPQGFLDRLDRAQRDAPHVLDLYVHAAQTWTERFATHPAPETEGQATIAPALASLLSRNEVLSRAKLRRTIASGLVILLVLWVAPQPLLMGAAALALLSIVHALAFDPTARIYREILRPAIAAWAWQGHDLDDVVVALKSEVHRLPTSRRVLEPDTPSRYPELLAADQALAAWATTARLRAP
jgi:hypothetical protein